MATERRRVFFSGHVQGVGFRMTTRRLAANLPIVGFVRNLADGRVELLVQGESGSLNDLIAAIHREFGASIRETVVTLEALDDPPLAGFAIR